MVTDPIQSLEARLIRLERRARRGSIVTTVLAGLLGVAVLCGSVWKDSPRLDVRELRLLDDRGHPRLLLTQTGDGHPKLLMLDADGLPRAQYTAEALAFEDRGTVRATLTSHSGLTLFDGQGKRRSELYVDDTGAFLRLNHGPKNTFARMGVGVDGVKYATQSTSATP